MLAADALGIGSCYIGQGWTAFADPFGQETLQSWGIPATHYAVMQLLLGYPRQGDGHPAPKPRTAGRVRRFGQKEDAEMDLQACLKKLQYVGVLAFATVDGAGAPQVRNISAIHYEPDGLYFFTARGKDFCRELLADGRVQVLGYTKYKEMIRLSGRAVPVAREEQRMRIDQIFAEQPYLANVYPGDTREIGIVFAIREGQVEYFHLGVHPIFRQTYALGA